MGYIAVFGDKGNACNILIRKPKGKRPLKRDRHNVRVLLRKQNMVIWTGYICPMTGNNFIII
jgi:hypothetical protein